MRTPKKAKATRIANLWVVGVNEMEGAAGGVMVGVFGLGKDLLSRRRDSLNP